MSLKQEIETWALALQHYDRNEFDAALAAFTKIADTSKILFNCGVIYATLGEHRKAVDCYQRAVQLDRYLAVAYFQQGVSNFLMGDFEEALANFNDTLLYLRGNSYIDYDQLGLRFKLRCCEVLFNRGLCYIYLQQKKAGMDDLRFAAREKAVPDHDVIDEAIREQAEGYTVFSIPVGIVYRPNEAKVKNLKTKDYLGKARLVAQHDHNAFKDPRQQVAAANLAFDSRTGQSYAAMNLVKPGLFSRSRQQSEPPINRSIFPPTPPPEIERPTSASGKRRSTESANGLPLGLSLSRHAQSKPIPLDLGIAAFDKTQQRTQPSKTQHDKPRLGTKRSASERPQKSRERGLLTLEDASLNQRNSYVEPARRHKELCSSERPSPEPLRPTIYHRRSKSYTTDLPLRQQRPISIEEEDSESPPESEELDPGLSSAASVSARSDTTMTTNSTVPLAFEIVQSNMSDNRSRRPHSRRRTPRQQQSVELKRIRVKVHADDTRYVLVLPGVKFVELVDLVRKKFGFVTDFKVKMRDEEGDMITMGDEEDLEMCVGSCRKTAAEEGSEMGKMDIWIQEL